MSILLLLSNLRQRFELEALLERHRRELQQQRQKVRQSRMHNSLYSSIPNGGWADGYVHGHRSLNNASESMGSSPQMPTMHLPLQRSILPHFGSSFSARNQVASISLPASPPEQNIQAFSQRDPLVCFNEQLWSNHIYIFCELEHLLTC